MGNGDSTAVVAHAAWPHPPTTPRNVPSNPDASISIAKAQADSQRGSLANALWRGFRALRCGDGVPRDDRGTAITLVNIADVIETIQPASPERAAWRRISMLMGPAYLIGYFAWRGVTWQSTIPIIAAAAIPLIALLTLTNGRRDTSRRRISTLLLSARCGACGFTLLGLEADADNCVTCPECAAAWNRDRWTTHKANTDDRAAARALANVQRGNVSSEPRLCADDRGVMLDRPLSTRPRWTREIIRRRVAEVVWSHRCVVRAFEIELRSHRQRILKKMATLIGLLFALVAWGLMGQSPLYSVIVLSPIVILTAMIGVLWYGRLCRNIDTRGIALQSGLCPACGEMLDLSQPRQFDGCIQCATCAAAWKTDAVPPGASVASCAEMRHE